jgi:hypothetical protein
MSHGWVGTATLCRARAMGGGGGRLVALRLTTSLAEPAFLDRCPRSRRGAPPSEDRFLSLCRRSSGPAVQRSSGPAVQRSNGHWSSVQCPVSSVQRSKPGRKPPRLPHPLSPSIPRRCGSRRPPRLTPTMRSPVPAEFPYHSRRGRQRRSGKTESLARFQPGTSKSSCACSR